MPPKNAGKGGGGQSKKAEQKKKEKIIEVGKGPREKRWEIRPPHQALRPARHGPGPSFLASIPRRRDFL